MAPGPNRVVHRGPKGLGESLREIVERRALLAALVRRDLSSRYAGTMLGAVWVLLQPALLVAFYTFIFSVVFRIRAGAEVEALTGSAGGHLGYALYVLGGLVPWLGFAECLRRAAGSIIQNKAIITKVVFPMELLPIAAVTGALVGFLATTLVVVLLAAFTSGLSWHLLWLPLVTLVLGLLGLGLGYALAVIGTFVRDLTNVIPFVITLWMYATPVFYPRSAIPGGVGRYLLLNPVAGVVEAYRHTVVFARAPEPASLGYSAAFAAGALLLGFWLFRRAQRLFAEVL